MFFISHKGHKGTKVFRKDVVPLCPLCEKTSGRIF